MSNILGEFIRGERRGKELTLREVSRRTGLSPAFLSDIELGRRTMSPRALSRVADALKIPVDRLISVDARQRIEYYENKIAELKQRRRR